MTWIRPYPAVREGHGNNLDKLRSFVVEHAKPLSSPMVLISQVFRSGGTLLNQLLDGHPAFAVCPIELQLDCGTRAKWPRIDPTATRDELFQRMFDTKLARLAERGYSKGEHMPERLRFLFAPSIHYAVFGKFVGSTERSVFDAYFTGQFNAWLDYQGDLAIKKWVAAFSPSIADDAENVAAFFSAYSDGYLVQCVRDPAAWLASAIRHRRTRKFDLSVDDLIGHWIEGNKAILRNHSQYGDRIIVLRSEELITKTEFTMRHLARRLNVEFNASMLVPTFNGWLVQANSSFPVASTGIQTEPLKRSESLSSDDRERVTQRCTDLYEAVLALAETQ